MGFRPFTNDQGTEIMTVDKTLGASYKIVRLVADHIEYLKSLADNLTGLEAIAGSIDALNHIYTQLDNLDTISSEMGDLTPIINHMTEILEVQANIANLMVLHGSLSDLQDLYDNISPVVAQLTTVAENMTELGAVYDHISAIETVAGLEANILAIPGQVEAVEEAAQDAADAVASLNLPIVTTGDIGKALFVNEDGDGYELQDMGLLMLENDYDPQNIKGDAFNTDNHTSGETNSVFSLEEKEKLTAVEIEADVTDKDNVGQAINAATAKETVLDGDFVSGSDSAAEFVLTRWTWANVKAAFKASAANVWAAAANKFLTTDMIETASAYVTLTTTAVPIIDWDAGINFKITINEHIMIGNPLNGQPGTTRCIWVQGNTGTLREISFDSQFIGDKPDIPDCTNQRHYELTIKCHTETHFSVTAVEIRSP